MKVMDFLYYYLKRWKEWSIRTLWKFATGEPKREDARLGEMRINTFGFSEE